MLHLSKKGVSLSSDGTTHHHKMAQNYACMSASRKQKAMSTHLFGSQSSGQLTVPGHTVAKSALANPSQLADVPDKENSAGEEK